MGNNKIIKSNKISNGFTIVELLVVIVIIGILASITLVSYAGISKKAIEVSIISELGSNKKKLELYKAEYGTYPTALDTNNCPVSPNVNNNYCLGSDLIYTPSPDGLSFNLELTKSGITYNTTDSIQPALAKATSWKQVATGHDHTCAISNNNRAYCWGLNAWGQLGNGNTDSTNTPKAVNTDGVLKDKTIVSISANGFLTCALDSNGHAYCWGSGNYGQLGNNATSNSNVPVAVDMNGILSGKTIKSISVGYSVCAIASDDNAYCWGRGSDGQLGNNSTSNSSTPVAVYKSGALNGLSVKSISSGLSSACAVASNDNVYCWGQNSFTGMLGNNSTTASTVPVAVDKSGVLNGKTIKTVSVGLYSVSVITNDDKVYSWGSGLQGELGNGSSVDSLVPTTVVMSGVLNGKTVKSISSGGHATYVITNDSLLYSWGENDGGSGALGNNLTVNSNVPVMVYKDGALNGKTIKSVSGGSFFACAIASDDQIYCWGYDNDGQLGNGLNTTSIIPVLTLLPQ